MFRNTLLAASALALLASPASAQNAAKPDANDQPVSTQSRPTDADPQSGEAADPNAGSMAPSDAEPNLGEAAGQAPAGAGASAAASGAATVRVAPAGNIIATLKAAGQFNTLVKALDDTQLTPVLSAAGPLTIFAPTDAAFNALPPGERQRLLNDKAALQQALLLHVVNARVTSEQLMGKKGPVKTGGGVDVTVDGTGEGVSVEGARVAQADVAVSNGVVHVVDQLIRTGGAASAAVTTPATAGEAATTAAPAADVQAPDDGAS